MARNVRGLTWRPITPGSDEHLALLDRTRRHGRLLYPDLFARRDAEAARRASQRIHLAATRVPTKHETGPVSAEPASTTFNRAGGIDGCNDECA